MADDLSDAESTAQTMAGIDNNPLGRVVVRVLRTVRVLAGRLKSLEDRVSALEGRTQK